ncbi:MAG: AAA family ATPase, partial [Gammaproteobacteria bacterium]|nr:AAA family ATPase [Gammaproteobacteria bacterium]NNJ84189.1 AAA family ATPase [Gammaproteobacteria bacterium]
SMTDLFLTNIKVNQSRNIRDFEIPLSERARKHLIITGKNGSGKTSLLNELFVFLRQVDAGNPICPDYLKNSKSLPRINADKELKELPPSQMSAINQLKKLAQRTIDSFGGTEISFTVPDAAHEHAQKGDFLIAFYEAKRATNLTVPTGVTKVKLKEKYSANERAASKSFIQYLVNLKVERSFARDEDDGDAAQAIDDWFVRFEDHLKTLFQSPTLQLKFDRKNYNFEIIEEGKLPFNLNTLSDGYSAIISIVTDLILRMEGHGNKAYDLQGVVLIDEIETHLHVDLQKRILPFLIDFFPKIQFVVSTHSPFVLSSVPNAVICDLEERIVTEDLSAYSYDALVESYFDVDKYSDEVKQKVARFEVLRSASTTSAEEKDELQGLKDYFFHAPKYLSTELTMKLQQIELQNPPQKGNG